MLNPDGLSRMMLGNCLKRFRNVSTARLDVAREGRDLRTAPANRREI